MKIAIVGSRGLKITAEELERCLPENVTEIISGGARGIDRCARAYARSRGLPLTEFLPDYAAYGRSAPLRRNREIVARADLVLAFWDGSSRGTQFVVEQCKKSGKPVKVFLPT